MIDGEQFERLCRAAGENETRFRRALDHAVIGMALLDAEGRFTLVNRSLRELLGYTEAELLGRHFNDITHPEDRQGGSDQVRRLLAGEVDSFQMRKRYLHKKGEVLWAEISVAVFRANGKTASLVVQIQDITERRRAEEALVESQGLLQGIIDNSTAVIFIKDLQGRFLLANRRCRELFPIVPGSTVYDLFSKEQADALHTSDQRALAAGTAIEAEEEILQEDGVHTYISIKAPIRDSSGRVYAVCGVSTDITERKKAERHQAAQFAIAGVLAGSATLTEAAPRLLQILCESLSWELGEIWIIDAKANLLRHLQSWHVPTIDAEAFIEGSRSATFAPGAGLPGRVWQKGAPEWVEDVLTGTEFMRATLAAAAGLHGALAFPIRVGSQILGVLAFFSREMRQPAEDLLEILGTIGNQVGQFMERKRAEEELRFSEERYRTLHRDNPTMIFTLNAEGRILSLNPFAASQLGYAIDELEGQSVLKVFHKDDRQPVTEQLHNCLRNPNQVYRWHLRKIRKDGALLWVEELAQAVYGPEGMLTVLVVCQDITERRQAEMALRQQEERFRYVALATRDAIYDWDVRVNRFWCNETYQELYAPNEPIGTDQSWWEQHIHADDRVRILESIQQAFGQRNTFWSAAYRFHRSDGSIASVVDRGYIIYDDRGPVRMIGAMTDVTREREIDRMKNEFISTAAHELRTPLTTVMGYLQLLQQQEERFTAAERKEFLALVYEKSEVLDRIIKDLLDLSRVQAGKLVTVEKVREDLAALVRHAVAAYQGISPQHVFRLEFPEEVVALCFDPNKMGQVFDNLFSNAVKFSPAGGSIRVRGRRMDGKFEVTVEDEGIGMHPEQAERIFDKFYRADASNTAVSGLGLGMSIVKNIIEAHGGCIWVESELGRGTQVHFILTMEGEDCPVRQQS